MTDNQEIEDGSMSSTQEILKPTELQDQRDIAWNEYFQKFDPNSEVIINQIMHNPEVQPWAKIKAMNSLLAPATHPDFRPFSGINAHKYDSVERFRSWIEYVGVEEAEYMAGKIPEYIQSTKVRIDAEPDKTSYESTALQNKLLCYYEMIPTVVRKLQVADPEAAERLFSLMVTIDLQNQDDEGRVQTGHVLATLSDHLLDEKWKRMMANKIHKDIDASYGQEKQSKLVKEYIKMFDLILGSVDQGVEPPFSKTFFEDEIQYLLEVGNQRSGINLRHTLSALELLRDSPELAHQFARGQILPKKRIVLVCG